MKILIYGFGHYKEYKENFSEKVVNNIKSGRNIKKIILPVQFKRKNILEEINKIKPDIILGLGQDSRPRSSKIRIERKAKNEWRNEKGEKIKNISKKAQNIIF